MENMEIKYEQSQRQEHGYNESQDHWGQTSGYSQAHQQTSGLDYISFALSSPHLPVGNTYANSLNRPLHHQPQHLIMPQWPSMMTSQATYVTPSNAAAPFVPLPMSTPIPVTRSHASHTGSTPRRTLTDADRRRMCQYHEEHPTTKQSEIGAMFGVERSTVSKVLRQKEKYLFDEGSRSPIKRTKGKHPDIERALAIWAKNQQRQGLPLSDSIIKEKARFFATTVGSSDSASRINSFSWLEKFKGKNNLMGARSRDEPSPSRSPSDKSPNSYNEVSSPGSAPVQATTAGDGFKGERMDGMSELSQRRQPVHSLSTASLSSAFTDAAPSFSPRSTSPTTLTSPFYTPDSTCPPYPSPFIPSPQSGIASIGGNFHRRRSQTFPLPGAIDLQISAASSSEYLHSAAPETSMPEMTPSIPFSINETILPSSHATSGAGTPTSMLPPPPPPPATLARASSSSPLAEARALHTAIAHQPPSQDDARRAMEVVMSFFQAQPPGSVEPQDYMTMGKLMEKLKLRGGLLPGGMHAIAERERESGVV